MTKNADHRLQPLWEVPSLRSEWTRLTGNETSIPIVEVKSRRVIFVSPMRDRNAVLRAREVVRNHNAAVRAEIKRRNGNGKSRLEYTGFSIKDVDGVL